MIITYKDQPGILINNVEFIRKDESSHQNERYAILFHVAPMDRITPNHWGFKEERERDIAYEYICSLDEIKSRFETSLCRKS